MRRAAPLLALLYVLVLAPASRADEPLVPRFQVTAKTEGVRVDGRQALVVRQLRVDGIHGHLHVGCDRCRRYRGTMRRTTGKNSLVISHANWIITASRSILVSVTREGQIGRFARLGVKASHPGRLVFEDSGCMTARLRRRTCPPGTASPTATGTVPVFVQSTPTTPAASTTAPATTTVPVAAVLVNPPALPSPTNLRVTPTTTDAVTLAWDPPPDASGITGYTVYIDALAATTTPATSITVGLSCGTTNRLGVSAFGSDGRTSPVSVVTVSARACPVTHYNCPAAADGASHYVPAGKHWGNAFVAQGHTITGGTLLIGANVDGQDHRAQIGIFTGGPDQLSGELGSTVVDVHDYGGASFSFPSPIAVTPGQLLWLVAIGIGDFTAYDRKDNGADGCFIGSLVGFE